MKNQIIIIATLLFSLIGITKVQAQEINPKKNNYLILTKNIKQLSPVLQTAVSLAKEDKNKYGSFYVIICGKTVMDIIGNVEFINLLNQAEIQNVKIFACGISLKKFNINPENMPTNLEVTDNGILYGFQLSKKGFITLTI
jgi:intracellular sulfur oxidation DsrE/DsrF family protein